MKIIHTSDWHLGGSWNGIDRTEELFEQVDKVCAIVREKQADVLLVAGDIFERVSRDKLHKNSKILAGKIKTLLENGCHIVLVPGNHDYRDHFRLMKTFLELESGKSERIHVAEGFDEFEINGVQFIILPYPDRDVLEEIGKYRNSEVIGKAERNKILSDVLADSIGGISETINPLKPSVFVTHLQIIGVEYNESGYEASYNTDLSLASNCLPQNVSYIALGHIHKCYQIEKSAVPCWYSGSFERMDLGERNDDKFVLLVEIDEKTKKATVEKVPIETSKFEEITKSVEELEEFIESYVPNRRTYGKLILKYAKDDDILAKINFAKQHFGKNFMIVSQREDEPLPEASKFENPRDYKQTVFKYLEDELGESEDFAELKRRAEKLIEEVENVTAKN